MDLNLLDPDERLDKVTPSATLSSNWIRMQVLLIHTDAGVGERGLIMKLDLYSLGTSLGLTLKMSLKLLVQI